jgi:hypothetical protein
MSTDGELMAMLECFTMRGGACEDCTIAIANDDYSGMDAATEAKVRAGIARVNQHLVIGDNIGFTHAPCAVCGGLAGDRHEVCYLAETA